MDISRQRLDDKLKDLKDTLAAYLQNITAIQGAIQVIEELINEAGQDDELITMDRLGQMIGAKILDAEPQPVNDNGGGSNAPTEG